MAEEENMKQSRAHLVLDGDKIFRGKEVASGTILGEIKSAEGFTARDIDRTVQLHWVKVVPIVEK